MAKPRTTAEPELITQAEAAKRLGVSIRTIRRWMAEGRIVGYRLGTHLTRVDGNELHRVLTRVGGAS